MKTYEPVTQIRNPKSEIRKKSQCPNDPNWDMTGAFIWDLGFDSDFGLRISDLPVRSFDRIKLRGEQLVHATLQIAGETRVGDFHPDGVGNFVVLQGDLMSGAVDREDEAEIVMRVGGFAFALAGGNWVGIDVDRDGKIWNPTEQGFGYHAGFLANFAPCRRGWQLAWLQVATGLEPTIEHIVMDQQDMLVAAVEHDPAAGEMAGRGRAAANVRAGREERAE
jgi:hypothetical protein